jgi:hypothetical protein
VDAPKQKPGDDERKLKVLLKRQERAAKEKARRTRAKERDRVEAKETRKEDNMMILIYPLVPHRIEFYIDEHYEEEEQQLRKDIEAKRQLALEAAGGDKRKMDFDVRRDCYIPDVKNFVFDLEV